MTLSRRQVLQAMIASAALTLPGQRFLTAQTTNHIPDYLTALETPYAAPLNTHFEAVVRRHNIDLLLYDLDNARLVTALAPENPLPVASVFKAPMLIYFLDTVDPSIWRDVPVAEWVTSGQPVLRALYQALVRSDNPATGQVLSYLAEIQDSREPLVLFNDWARDRVGASQLSALSAWNQGIAANMSAVDPRYLGRGTTVSGQIVTFENLMTPRDLGLFYLWMLDHLPPEGLRVCLDLLSTIHDNRGANLERLATDLGGTPYSKNGSLITDAGTVITDAGLIELPDGHRYLLVMLSLAATDALPTVFEELNLILRGRYNEIIHNHRFNAVSADELLATYTAHLQTAYPQQIDQSAGVYRYGFVLPEGVQVYDSERKPLHNPIIRSTRFGVHLLMQGALVRFVDVDYEWVELMPDDDRDNVRVRLGSRLFVQRQNIWPIALDYGQPIPNINDGIRASDKFIVINLQARELMAFEGAQPVLRVPIVLNPDATPRGVQVITSKWLARSMQPWAPGVPFTSFFGSEGYALHGSPWQRWTTTVNQENIYGRTSAGCVNIPDWMVRVGDYYRPADELLFRWIGGMENAHNRVFDYPNEAYPALRIFSVDYLHNLHTYYLPEGLIRANASWEAVIDTNIRLQAPDSFFV